MIITTCPECSNSFGERVGKVVEDDDVLQEFECAECGNEWMKTL